MTGAAEILLAGTRDTFCADECTVEAGAVTATGRWRRKWGPGNSRSTYSEPVTRTWPVSRCEVRWVNVQVAA